MRMAKEKLILLWKDKRSWKVRLPLAALCSFACVFTFVIFGPCEIFAQNASEMPFPFSDLLKVMLTTGALAFVLLFGVLTCLRGKIFNLTVSFLFAATLAGYLQGNFWNIDHGSLTGDTVDWLLYKIPMVKNCMLWICIFAAVFILLYLSRRLWTQGINLGCAIVIGAQMVAFVSLFAGGGYAALSKAGRGEYSVTRDGMFELSEKKNTVVFLLDRCDRAFAEELLEKNPEWEKKLSGFTSYYDFVGSYSRTYPSITYLLTGKQNEFTTSWGTYFKEAWSSSAFLPDIHASGYDTKVYTNCGYVFGDGKDVADFVDNVKEKERVINDKELMEKMLILSAYRYVPEAMKPYFQMYSEYLNEVISLGTENAKEEPYRCDDAAFWQQYRDNGGIEIDKRSQGTFMFYHLQGAHPPCNLNEWGEYSERDPGSMAQLAGNFNMIFQYIEAMKDKGIYDKSTIIITTDHAFDFPNGWLSELDAPRMLLLLVKPAGADLTEPMKLSKKEVCQDNLRASMAAYMGLDGTAYGLPLETISEDKEMTRYFWMQAYDEETKTIRDDAVVTYRIRGDANDFSSWEMIARDPIYK